MTWGRRSTHSCAGSRADHDGRWATACPTTRVMGRLGRLAGPEALRCQQPGGPDRPADRQINRRANSRRLSCRVGGTESATTPATEASASSSLWSLMSSLSSAHRHRLPRMRARGLGATLTCAPVHRLAADSHRVSQRPSGSRSSCNYSACVQDTVAPAQHQPAATHPCPTPTAARDALPSLSALLR